MRLGDVKRLQAADVIVEDRGAQRAARAFYRREATRLVVGRADVPGEIAPEALEAMMAQEVAEGRRVVLLTAM